MGGDVTSFEWVDMLILWDGEFLFVGDLLFHENNMLCSQVKEGEEGDPIEFEDEIALACDEGDEGTLVMADKIVQSLPKWDGGELLFEIFAVTEGNTVVVFRSQAFMADVGNILASNGGELGNSAASENLRDTIAGSVGELNNA